ncbi:hypothetical protein ACFOW1_09640 [Parasediminibacterium paludis]|uniref:Uncharacterized protein n=1 Tax=Parasediminibacterium paludis TaxID=908966 RepID=A0ABV8PVM0_9BACT
MITTKANPFAAINQSYMDARAKAKQYIIENLYWSERTFYRKMNQPQKLSDRENEVIATAFKIFIHEPLQAVFETALA